MPAVVGKALTDHRSNDRRGLMSGDDLPAAGAGVPRTTDAMAPRPADGMADYAGRGLLEGQRAGQQEPHRLLRHQGRHSGLHLLHGPGPGRAPRPGQLRRPGAGVDPSGPGDDGRREGGQVPPPPSGCRATTAARCWRPSAGEILPGCHERWLRRVPLPPTRITG